MLPDIVRPDSSWGEDKREELQKYLKEQWDRAVETRAGQVDEDFTRWEKNYKAQPREARRTLPWVGSSNFVVPLIRMFMDTFVARTLNIVFATRPLYVVSGYPRELKESLEMYLNHKSIHEWGHYRLCRDLLQRGNKNGTVVTKTPWVELTEWDVKKKGDEQEITTFSGPQSRPIPFDDFYVYPITAEWLDQVVTKFHRTRYVEEVARRRVQENKWLLDETDVESALSEPTGAHKEDLEEEAGVHDNKLREMNVIECHLAWPLGGDPNRYYNVVASIEEKSGKLVDVYYNPYPRNVDIFHEYKPFPREGLFWGESMAQIAEQFQEETSEIHNDRRNNSYLGNAPMFKRRAGASVPNPSTTWYPGKVWDLEDLQDLDIVAVNRPYSDLIAEENNAIQLCERTLGIGAVMQGYAQGMMGKRGIYNTGGVLGILSEGNQRQDTNVRDVRNAMSSIIKCALTLQRTYGRDDPTIQFFDAKVQEQIKQALEYATPDRIARSLFEVKVSNAGVNKEVERANLIQMGQVLADYGKMAMQLVGQLADPNLNATIRDMMLQTLRMQKWMAARLLRAMDEHDGEEVLPDARTAIELTQPGKGTATTEQRDQGRMEPGGAGGNGAPLDRAGLQALSQIPLPPGGQGGFGGMAAGPNGGGPPGYPG